MCFRFLVFFFQKVIFLVLAFHSVLLFDMFDASDLLWMLLTLMLVKYGHYPIELGIESFDWVPLFIGTQTIPKSLLRQYASLISSPRTQLISVQWFHHSK